MKKTCQMESACRAGKLVEIDGVFRGICNPSKLKS